MQNGPRRWLGAGKFVCMVLQQCSEVSIDQRDNSFKYKKEQNHATHMVVPELLYFLCCICITAFFTTLKPSVCRLQCVLYFSVVCKYCFVL